MSLGAEKVETSDRRAEILAAAHRIVREEGAAALTQPRVARYTGLRQSHITYYFPRKSDLYAALLTDSHDRASALAWENGVDCCEALLGIVFDAESMRFFLSMLTASADSPELRAAITAHTRELETSLAHWIGREPGDADVSAFLDALRGLGLRALAEPDLPEPDVKRLARRYGLDLPTDRPARTLPEQVDATRPGSEHTL